MNEFQENTAESAKSKSWILKLLLLLAALLVVLLILLVRFLFSPWQEVPPVKVTPGDMLTQYRLMNRLYKQYSRKKKPLNNLVLQLSVDEVNSLFRLAGNIKPKNSQWPIRYYHPSLDKDGVFSVVLPIQTPLKLLRGGTIYAKLRFTIAKAKDGELQVRIVSVKATSIPLSSSGAQKFLDKMLAQEETKQKLHLFNKMVQSLSFSNGKLQVECSPQILLGSQPSL